MRQKQTYPVSFPTMSEASEKVAKQLLREAKWAQSWLGRRSRSIMFLFGFAQCRHCVHCDLNGSSKYRGIRESVLPVQGRCMWQEGNVSGVLDRGELKQFHRCPGFEQILYNFKDYGFPADEIARIKERRWRLFITWMGWMIAVAISVIGWVLK